MASVRSDSTISQLASTPAVPIRCLCGHVVGPHTTGREWLLASHLATHDPLEVVAVADEVARGLLLAIDTAFGWVDVMTPELIFDIGMARNVLVASNDQPVLQLHVKLVERTIRALRDAALALSTSVVDEDLVGVLDCAAIELSELITERACRPLPGSVSTSNPVLRIGPATPVVTNGIRRALSLLDRPLLVAAPPLVDNVPIGGGRSCQSLIDVLHGLPRELGQLESQVRSELGQLRFTAEPLPVASDAALDRIAALVLELNLAHLQASCLAKTLATAHEPELQSWTAATAGRVVARAESLAEQLSLLLLSFEL